MTLTNQGFVLKGVYNAKVEPMPSPPKPGPNEVTVQTIAVGICGSDLHFWKEGNLATYKFNNEPTALGHETVAKIIEVGSNVVNLKPGDRVAVEPFVACDSCKLCYLDMTHICENIKCQAVAPFHGSLQKYFNYPAKYCLKVPENMTNDEVAMVEPLSVAVYGCRRGNVTFGDQVLITGAGPIGLFSLHAARAYGATRIVLTDINESRLKIAKKMGANETILMSKTTTEQEATEQIRQAFGGELPNITLECSGAPFNYRLGILATRSGGKCVLLGIGPTECEIPIGDCILREISIIPMIRFNKTFPTAIQMIATGKVNLAHMVSHHFSFEDSEEAFKTAASGQGVKIIINVNQ